LPIRVRIVGPIGLSMRSSVSDRLILGEASVSVRTGQAADFPIAIRWPDFDGSQTDQVMELWWVTSLLKAGSRRLAAFMVFSRIGDSFFRSGVVLTDLDAQLELASRRTLLQASDVSLAIGGADVRWPTGHFRGSAVEGYQLSASLDPDASFDLSLKVIRPVLFNGGSGAFLWNGVGTEQVSMGGIETSGVVHVNGEELHVTGTSWYDRQTLAATPAPDLRFWWNGLWLSNGDTLSIWDDSMCEGGKSWATLVRSDGTHILASVKPQTDTVSSTYVPPVGAQMPRRWTVEIPKLATTLVIDQQTVQDDPVRKNFFTGSLTVEGVCNGTSVTGSGVSDFIGLHGFWQPSA
jgi:predicted secreted hydrolase